MHHPRALPRSAFGCLLLAALLPTFVAFNQPPSPTIYNQLLALACWGAVVMSLAAAASTHVLRPTLPAVVAMAACALASTLSVLVGDLPSALALSAAGTLVAAACLTVSGASVASNVAVHQAFFTAWLIAGLSSAGIAIGQVFVPHALHPDWFAQSGTPGRAVGNLRQPNHLAILLLWSALAVVPLFERGRMRRAVAAATYSLLVFAIVLSASRTGFAGLLLLAGWGLVDRRLSLFVRTLLLSSPLLYAVGWWAMVGWAELTAQSFSGAARLASEGFSGGSRRLVWHDTMQLISANPWRGVGFGEFNRAWTLTPFSTRSGEFFDHSHNLVLELLVELGVPVGMTVLGLLIWGLYRALERGFSAQSESTGPELRATGVMLLLMALHSLLEYPLWYAHFLLPTAFAWGLCLGPVDAAKGPRAQVLGYRAIGAAMVVAAALALIDYQRVAAIFSPRDDAAPLEQRIADGQRSWFFAHHADYARITTFEETTPPTLADFRRATHFLLDTRLLVAWANAHARAGDVERARWIADRLRELKQSSAEPYFAPCTDPAVVDKPYQCTNASRTFSWRDFK